MSTSQKKLSGMEISKNLKRDIDLRQKKLNGAMCKHQIYLAKLRADPNNVDILEKLKQSENIIILLGLEQKKRFERLREASKAKPSNSSVIKNGTKKRRCNSTNAPSQARTRNIADSRPAASATSSDNSVENASPGPSPNPVEPHDVSQAEFLTYFSLATPEVYQEMKNRKVGRKRRSTVNPNFYYGNNGWNFLTNGRRKCNTGKSETKKKGQVPPKIAANSIKQETSMETV